MHYRSSAPFKVKLLEMSNQRLLNNISITSKKTMLQISHVELDSIFVSRMGPVFFYCPLVMGYENKRGPFPRQ